MRVYVLFILVAFLVIYAWKDWFKSLCGLILLMAFLEHPDMPKTLGGIQGLNPWNILFVSVVLSWLVNRKREGLTWQLPRIMTVLLVICLCIIVIGFARLMMDRQSLAGSTALGLFSDQLFNTLKYPIPGLMLFDGCRTERRLWLATFCTLAISVLLSLLVAKAIPARSVFEGGEHIDNKRLSACKETGYRRTWMSPLLAGGTWAFVACFPICRRKWQKVAVVAAAVIGVYGMALTGGRAGYAAFVAIGLILCLLRWRKGLLPACLVPVVLLAIFPASSERLFSGFEATNLSGQATRDVGAITAGRSDFWPIVIDKIAESPYVGYGRLGMIRSGATQRCADELGAGVPHPHNMYLQWMLDNGLLGMAPVVILFGWILFIAGRLFMDRQRPWCSVAGGICLAYVLAQLIGGFGSGEFYPEAVSVSMWAVLFLMVRVHVERLGLFGGGDNTRSSNRSIHKQVGNWTHRGR